MPFRHYHGITSCRDLLTGFWGKVLFHVVLITSASMSKREKQSKGSATCHKVHDLRIRDSILL